MFSCNQFAFNERLRIFACWKVHLHGRCKRHYSCTFNQTPARFLDTPARFSGVGANFLTLYNEKYNRPIFVRPVKTLKPEKVQKLWAFCIEKVPTNRFISWVLSWINPHKVIQSRDCTGVGAGGCKAVKNGIVEISISSRYGILCFVNSTKDDLIPGASNHFCSTHVINMGLLLAPLTWCRHPDWWFPK